MEIQKKISFTYGTPKDQQPLLTMPSNPLTDLLMEVAPNVEDLPTYKARKESITKGGHRINIKEAPLQVWKERADSYTVGISILNAKGLKSIGKVYTFLLKLASEQCFVEGKMINNTISTPLRAFVDANIYSDVRNARRAYTKIKDILRGIDVGIKVKAKKGKQNFDFKGSGPMFAFFSEINKNSIEIKLNTELPWDSIMEYFKTYMYLPQQVYSLSLKAFDLAFYISYLARQNGKSIKEHGGFAVSNRAIQLRLGLPDETKIKNPGRDIREVIDKAVWDILQLFRDTTAPAFTIEQRNIDTTSTKEYLDNGDIWVTVSGEMKEAILKQETHKVRIIETKKKRLEKIIDKAKVNAKTEELKEKGGGNNAEN